MSEANEAAGTPRERYEERLRARRATRERLGRRLEVIANARLAAFLAGLLLGYFAIVARSIAPGWLIAPALVFVVLVAWHGRVARRWRRAGRAAFFYEQGLARLDDRWAGLGNPSAGFLDPHHPFALDLDLFGPGSLFERLDTSRTRAGAGRLASWLLEPAGPEEVSDRQGAVAELRPRLDLREELATLGEDVPEGIDLAALAAWGAAPPTLTSVPARLAAAALAAALVAGAAAWALTDLGSPPFALALLPATAFVLAHRSRVRAVVRAVEGRGPELIAFAELLARLEAEPFGASSLVRLAGAVGVGGEPASRRIAGLARLIDLLDSRRNLLFALLAPLLLWSTQMAFAVEAWRRRCGPAISGWLDAVAEAEALGSIASYAFENPSDPFPEVVTEGPVVVGEGLAHPLIPAARAVPNDVALGGERRVLVVSGSNMSGKSTLLRTVGVNVVLALAGAPVRARALRVSPLSLGATLRIQDSLREGQSRFFAEITRVRQLVDLASGPRPLLFLLDEVFSGTNSHDRRIGAEAIVRGLIGRGAIGLVTTHDLALAEVADRLGPRAANVHFEDHFENGRIAFDYRMHPGVVRKSNALELMRAVGLDVEPFREEPTAGALSPGSPVGYNRNARDPLSGGSRPMAGETPWKTPLHDWHAAHGGRMVEFGGWSMPVQYTTIVEEHRAVREGVGLFDISHMGRLRFAGDEAQDWVDRVTTNNIARIAPGGIQYSLMTDEAGGVLDDVLVYRMPDGNLRMVCNASNRARVLTQLEDHKGALDASSLDLTFTTAMIAVQGPEAEATLQRLFDGPLSSLGYYRVTEGRLTGGRVPGTQVVVSRTGYTGEDGFEVIVPAPLGVSTWEALLEAGRDFGIRPCGLGARDTLRFEAGMPLYGHELSESINPYAAGLGWAVKLGKGDFIGRDALCTLKDNPGQTRVGLELTGKRIARQGSVVRRGPDPVGAVTSGTFSPTLGRSLAMAVVDPSVSSEDTELIVDVRGHDEPARVVPLPFYRRGGPPPASNPSGTPAP